MKLPSCLSDFIWVEITEAVLDAEEDDLTVLPLPVELQLLPHFLTETPECSVPGVLQPVRRVGEVQVSVSGTGEVLRPVATVRHLTGVVGLKR